MISVSLVVMTGFLYRSVDELIGRIEKSKEIVA
jgi:hypothetical protein